MEALRLYFFTRAGPKSNLEKLSMSDDIKEPKLDIAEGMEEDSGFEDRKSVV